MHTDALTDRPQNFDRPSFLLNDRSTLQTYSRTLFLSMASEPLFSSVAWAYLCPASAIPTQAADLFGRFVPSASQMHALWGGKWQPLCVGAASAPLAGLSDRDARSAFAVSRIDQFAPIGDVRVPTGLRKYVASQPAI